jgi:hypothetical protein
LQRSKVLQHCQTHSLQLQRCHAFGDALVNCAGWEAGALQHFWLAAAYEQVPRVSSTVLRALPANVWDFIQPRYWLS